MPGNFHNNVDNIFPLRAVLFERVGVSNDPYTLTGITTTPPDGTFFFIHRHILDEH